MTFMLEFKPILERGKCIIFISDNILHIIILLSMTINYHYLYNDQSGRRMSDFITEHNNIIICSKISSMTVIYLVYLDYTSL